MKSQLLEASLTRYSCFLIGLISSFVLLFYILILNVKNIGFIITLVNDCVNYINTAHSFVEHGELTENIIYNYRLGTSYTRQYMPGYFMILAASFRFFGVSAFTAILPNAFMYVLSGVLVYLIGKKLYGREVGFLAALWFVLTPLMVFYAITAMSELAIITVSLVVFYIFICAPKNAKYYLVPLLLAIVFLFRQTTVLVIIPMIALFLNNKDNATSERIAFLVSLLAAGIILFLVNKWQIYEGMLPLTLKNMLAKPDVDSLSEYFFLSYDNFFINIKTLWVNLKGGVDFYFSFMFKIFFYVLFISVIFLVGYGWKRRKVDLYPFAVVSLALGMFLLTLTVYTGTIPTLLRMCLFSYPFVVIAAVEMILNLKSKSSSVLFNSFSHCLFFLLIFVFYILTIVNAAWSERITLQTYSAVAKSNEKLLDSVNIDRNKLFVAPVELIVSYAYNYYPGKVSFIPSDRQGLNRLNKKYPIGTLIVSLSDLNDKFTIADIEQLGLSLVNKSFFYNDEKCLVFKRL